MCPSARTGEFCPECGSVLPEISQRIEGLEESLRLAERDLRGKRSLVARLRGEQNAARPPEYEDAMEVARYWRDTIRPTAKELNGPRLINTIARLKHYTAEDLKKSIWGYYCCPYVHEGERVPVGPEKARYDDLELIMRDAKHVEKGIEIAVREARYDTGLIKDGSSRAVASLCDCQHPRADHALERLHGHNWCLYPGCACNGFDDLDWQMREHELAQARPKRQRHTIPPPGQEQLL